METGLAGKVAIVTGGSGGIGLACVRALVAEGARVVLGDVNGEAAEAAAAELGADVASPWRWTSRARTTRSASWTSRSSASAGSTCSSRARACIATRRSTGLARGVGPAARREPARRLPHGPGGAARLRAAAQGRIVALASLASQTGGLAASAAYAASKGGVVTLTKSLARYAGPHNVTANCVNPGIIDSPMTAGWSAEDIARLTAGTPLGRLGTTDEVAAAVVFLASDAASFITGVHIDVNGGILMD